MQNIELKEKLLLNITKGFEQDVLSNEDLIDIITSCGMYLNLQTISDYARDKKISYNGVKNFRESVILFGVKFVVDNS
jgi:hypothetical protein